MTQKQARRWLWLGEDADWLPGDSGWTCFIEGERIFRKAPLPENEKIEKLLCQFLFKTPGNAHYKIHNINSGLKTGTQKKMGTPSLSHSLLRHSSLCLKSSILSTIKDQCILANCNFLCWNFTWGCSPQHPPGYGAARETS